MDIYPHIMDYLTTLDKPDYRGIKKEVLELYRVGVGQQKFYNDKEALSYFDAVYYPMYAPRSKKGKESFKNLVRPSDRADLSQYEAVMAMNTEDFEVVKMKVRAVGKDNKHRQIQLPSGSDVR